MFTSLGPAGNLAQQSGQTPCFLNSRPQCSDIVMNTRANKRVAALPNLATPVADISSPTGNTAFPRPCNQSPRSHANLCRPGVRGVKILTILLIVVPSAYVASAPTFIWKISPANHFFHNQPSLGLRCLRSPPVTFIAAASCGFQLLPSLPCEYNPSIFSWSGYRVRKFRSVVLSRDY
jgi:hypothetical protein